MENLRRISGELKKIRRNGRNLSENGEKLKMERWNGTWRHLSRCFLVLLFS